MTIENLTSESFSEDDLSGIPDLVEVIKLQATGPAEAARAIRKKLKYGTAHRQIRALVLLDGLIQNAGPTFQRTFADEPLLERLRVCGTSDLSDPAVRKKCTELFREWSQYRGMPGLERVSRLHKVRSIWKDKWHIFFASSPLSPSLPPFSLPPPFFSLSFQVEDRRGNGQRTEDRGQGTGDKTMSISTR